MKRPIRGKDKIMVSVIIPCYNDGQYLEEAVMSACESFYKPLEIIIVDDGSEDALTRKVLRSMESAGRTVVYAQHGGPARARNEGIKRACGKYILPLDADDKISPEYISEAASILEERSDIGIVYCLADYFGSRTGEWKLPDYNIGIMLYQNIIFSAGMFRKSDWERAGGYDESFLNYLEDWDFWLSLLGLGLQPYRIEKIYFHYRKRGDSLSRSNTKITYEEKEQYLHKIRQKHLELYRQHIQEWADVLIDKFHQAKIDYHVLMKKHELSEDNRWLKLSKCIPWDKLAVYDELYPEMKEYYHAPFRLVFSIYLLRQEMRVTLSEIYEQLNENPYMRALCDLQAREAIPPEKAMQIMMQRLTDDALGKIDEICRQEN